MNNEQAKFILRAYRPGGRDAADPAFGDALRQAQADPALGAWLAREQSLDGAVASKLRALSPPPELREAILAGSRVSFAAPARGWRLPAWLAVAASIAVLIAGAGSYGLHVSRQGRASLDRLAAFALRTRRARTSVRTPTSWARLGPGCKTRQTGSRPDRRRMSRSSSPRAAAPSTSRATRSSRSASSATARGTIFT